MINLDDIVSRTNVSILDALLSSDESLSVKDAPSDCIEAIEKIVEEHGGDPNNVVYISGLSWDQRRFAVATDPEYTDRCRNHPYFQDLLGRSYNGKIFE